MYHDELLSYCFNRENLRDQIQFQCFPPYCCYDPFTHLSLCHQFSLGC